MDFQNEFNDTIVLQRGPPSLLQQGCPFTISIKINRRGAGMCSKQNFAVAVYLLNAEDLRPLNAMRGRLTSSIQPCEGNCVGHLTEFNDLTIHRPGKFRIRILLANSSLAGIIITARVHSNVFDVSSHDSSGHLMVPGVPGSRW